MFSSNLSSRPSRYMDGRLFFARPWFRSGTLVALTLLCCGCIVCELFLAFSYWGQLSRWITFMFFISLGVMGTWWQALRHHQRIRELYLSRSASENPESESLQGRVLSVGAEAISVSPLYPCTVILLLLFWVGYLIRHHP